MCISSCASELRTISQSGSGSFDNLVSDNSSITINSYSAISDNNNITSNISVITNNSNCISSSSSLKMSEIVSSKKESNNIRYPIMESDLQPIDQSTKHNNNGFMPISKDKLFYRNLLTNEEKQLYDLILYYAERYDTRPIFAPDLYEYNFGRMMSFLKYDNPQIYWLGDSWEWSEYNPNWKYGDNYPDKDHLFYINYKYSLNQVLEMQKEIDLETRKIMDGISPSDSQFDIEIYFHDYIVKNCVYDLSLEKSNNADIYGALIMKSPVCSGYSKAIQYLLNNAGIECIYVTGNITRDNKKIPHAWNIVNINGAYYQIDVTWDDPTPENGLIVHQYFNITTEMLKDRTFDDLLVYRNYSLPMCKDTADNYFVHKGLIFTEYDTTLANIILNYIIKESENKNEIIELKFTNIDAYNQGVDTLLNRYGLYEILQEAAKKCNNKFNIENSVYYEYKDLLIINIVIKYI